VSIVHLVCAGCGNTYLSYCEVCCARRRRARLRYKLRTCAACGISFTTTRTDARFCSNRCRQAHYRRRVKETRGVSENPRVSVTKCQTAND
jgi:endogenous inhibitor of DNA gyrase (YacG/DUF329 family)